MKFSLSRTLRRRILLGALLVLPVAGVVLAFDLRTVSTGSMEPTLWGRDVEGNPGDLLLIDRASYFFGHPERFDVVVYRDERDGSLRTKRVHGLPGETVQLVGGDLYVDDRLHRKSEAAWERCAVLLFDAELHPYRGERGFWTPLAPAEALERPAVRGGEGQRWRSRPLRSDYRAPDGSWRAGRFEVADAEIALRLAAPSGAGRWSLRWLRGDEVLAELELRRGADGAATLRLALAERPDAVVEERGRWEGELRVALRRLDGAWRLEVAGSLALARDLELHEGSPGELARRRSGALILELSLEGEGLAVEGCRVRRDLHHGDPRSADGASPRTRVGPEHYFVLGDHAEDSRDSLADGDVARRALQGRVLAVLHPGARRRWLL
jgi:signal peptidase I